MKKLVIILFCFTVLYACQQRVEEYNESNINQSDTLNIERIKIQTH